MSRFIDADAIDYRNDRLHGASDDFIRGIEYAHSCINETPTIEIPAWIPCSERLPNKDEMVLIFTEDTDIYVAELWDTYNEMLWWINDHRLMPLSEVYYWMPLSALPQPYREGE